MEKAVHLGVPDVKEVVPVVLPHVVDVEVVLGVAVLVPVVLVLGRVRMLVKLRVAVALVCVKIPIVAPNVTVVVEDVLVVPVRKKAVEDVEDAMVRVTMLV